MVAPIVAAAAVGAGMSLFSGHQQRQAAKDQFKTQEAFRQSLGAGFRNDPLLNQILGSWSSNLGRPFDQQQALQAGGTQIGNMAQRRAFDAMRRMQRMGMGGMGNIGSEMGAMIGQQAGQEMGALRDMVSTQYQQQLPQVMLEQLGTFLGGTGSTLGMAGGAGILNEPAGPAGGYERQRGWLNARGTV
jgi:hypothetical protein